MGSCLCQYCDLRYVIEKFGLISWSDSDSCSQEALTRPGRLFGKGVYLKMPVLEGS